MQITLRQVETFVWLAAFRNFTRVAEHLNTTQPNVSQRLTALETALGLQLFDRTGAITLTEHGKSLLPLAERMLEASEAFARGGDATRRTSLLRLGVSETVARTWLPRFLSEMEQRYPNVAIDLLVDLTSILKRHLAERTLDLAFLNGPISEIGMVNLPLGEVPLIWVAAPAIAARVPRGANAQDLTGFPILAHARNTQPYAEVVEYLRGDGRPLHRPMSSSNLAACIDLALRGCGIATLPPTLVADYLASGELVALDCAWFPSPMNFTASYLSSPPREIVASAAALAVTLVDWR